MKYYLIAGEASGDLHGSNLMKGILKADPGARFRFWGGDKMAAVGGAENLAMHYEKASFMGFTEVLKNLRVKKIRRWVDRLFVIFPFEVEYFRRRGIEAIYEGNPLMDAIDARRAALGSKEEFRAVHGLDGRPVVACLAGSRRSEIGYNLPFMVELSGRFPQYQFVVAGVPWLDRSVYEPLIAGSPVRYVCDATYELLAHSEAAVVTSGTATLETALLGTPEMVCYRRDWPSMLIGKMFLKTKYVSLVNLVLGRECVRELLQHHMTMANATAELEAILPGGAKHERIKTDYAELRSLIGRSGVSDRVGSRMVELLKSDMK